MEYLDADTARDRPGLRLALTAGGPGPWSESAKAIFHVKGIPFVAVRQDAGEPNAALHAWTGHRNAPVAIHEDEPARADWCGILLLAERVAGTPPLLPADAGARALALGISHEICGEQGLGWSRRLLMLHRNLEQRTRAGKSEGRLGFMAKLYGYAPERMQGVKRRVIELLQMLTSRIADQHRQGSDYLVGESLSAPDLYWACFAVMFAPLPHDLCPMPAPLREMYTLQDPELVAALDPALLAHRDRVYERHLTLPLEF